ncbi:MAG TPA: protein kinase [Kofleriaceae bacterium]
MGGSSDEMLAVGPRQVGRYALTERLGAGAMGEVWVAFDIQLDREIAIKIVHPSLARKPESAARMLREARAMAKLSHRAVVAIHDAGEAEGQLFLAMELVRGSTLAERFIKTGDWRARLRMVIEAGRGLAAAHTAGVLHRDFKPDNVLVDRSGRVAVSDFGLAALGTHAQPASRVTPLPDYPDLTATGALLGTPAYMSLEQLRGTVIDARSDQFAFCVVAYEALYGERPYRVNGGAIGLAELEETLEQARFEPPAHSNVPSELRAAVLRGMAMKPHDRWPSLEPLLDVLDRGLAPPKRRWRPYAIAGAAVMVLAAGVTSAVLLATKSSGPTAAGGPQFVGPTALRSTIAISPHGRLAVGTDKLSVQDFATHQTWEAPVDRSWTEHIQFLDDNSLRFSDLNTKKIFRWDFTREAQPVEEAVQPNGRWLGAAADGDLVQRTGAEDVLMLALVTGKRTLNAWQLDPTTLTVYAISPDGKKLAYVAGNRFRGHLVVLDLGSGKIWRSEPIPDVTAIAWANDHALIYGVATSQSLERVTIEGDRFSKATRVRTYERGFPALLAVAGSHLAYGQLVPTSRVHLADRAANRHLELEVARVAGEIGWTKDSAQLTWNLQTYGIEQRIAMDFGYETKALPITVAVEPVNATLAGDLAIIATRDTGGRKISARRMTTGALAWELPPGEAIAVRCASDLAAPCFIAREVDRRFEIWPLDLVTGKPVGKPVYRGELEDFAVDATASHLAIADGSKQLGELALATGELKRTGMTLSLARSIAYDPTGGILISGAAEWGRYSIGRIAPDGTFEFLYDAEAELLALVRPSPNGKQILSVGRAMSPTLWRDELAP